MLRPLRRYLARRRRKAAQLQRRSSFGEDAALLRLFRYRWGGFYVDVGASDPVKASNTWTLYHGYRWRGINVDIDPGVLTRLRADRPRDICVEAAVGDDPAPRDFAMFETPDVNTSDPQAAARWQAKGRKLLARRALSPRPLSEILDEHLPEGQAIDLLDIDAEGMDLSVLHSLDWSRHRPALVLVEDWDFAEALNAGTEGFTPIHRYLRDQGYVWVAHQVLTGIYRRADFTPGG